MEKSKKQYILSCNQIGNYNEDEEKCSVKTSVLNASSITCKDLNGAVAKQDDVEYCMFPLSSLGNITIEDFFTLKKELLNEYQRKRRASFTPEEKELLNEYQRAYQRKRRASFTPEEKERRAEYSKKRYASIPPEEKKRLNEAQRKRYASIPPEEKERYNEYQRKRYASIPPEEKERRAEYSKKRYASIPPEEKERLNEAQREKWRETHPPKVEEHISNEIERLRIKYRYLLKTEPDKAVILAKKIKKEEGKKFLEFMLDGLPQQAVLMKRKTM